jgi:hypothetical protein
MMPTQSVVMLLRGKKKGTHTRKKVLDVDLSLVSLFLKLFLLDVDISLLYYSSEQTSRVLTPHIRIFSSLPLYRK